MKNLIVQVRVFKGQVNHDANGNVTSENQLIKFHYGIKEWSLFLKNIFKLGWTKVDVVKCLDGSKKELVDGVYQLEEIETPDYVVEAIQAAMKGDEKPLTPEQQEIKELKEQVAALVDAGKSPKKEIKKEPKKDNTPNINEELEVARKKYHDVIGKKPNHLIKLANLNKAIAEKLAE